MFSSQKTAYNREVVVLVAMVERHKARLAQVTLERQRWAVRMAASAAECMEIASTEPIQFAVLDSKLPDSRTVSEEMSKQGVPVKWV